MSISAACPACDATYQLADTMRGKKVRCKSCSEVFVVHTKTVPPDSDEDTGGIQVSPRSAKRAVQYEEDEDTRRPQPRPRPRAKRGNGVLLPLLIVGGLVAVVLVLALAGVAVWAFTRSRQPQAMPVAVSSNPPANVPQPVQAPAPPQNEAAAPPPPMVPPVDPPPQPQVPANGPLAVELSNGKISGFGAQMQVTVDYRFTSGNPAGKRLFLLIKATKAAGLRQSYYLAELRSIGGRAEGSIGASGMTFGIEHGPFEMWVGEGPPGVGFPRSDREIKKISNVVRVASKQFAPPGMRPPIGPRRIPR